MRLASHIRGLNGGGAPIEREGAGRHPFDAQGDEVRNAQRVLLVEDAEWIAVAGVSRESVLRATCRRASRPLSMRSGMVAGRVQVSASDASGMVHIMPPAVGA